MPSAPVGGDLALTDHFDRAVTIRSFRGKHVLLFFGFTHCRVTCPTILGRLSKALDRLGPAAERIQPLYVTVDPDRDTPAIMQKFLEERFPRFLGLTGSAAEIATAKQEFKVFAQKKVDAAEPDGYAVPHSAFSFVLDAQGQYLTHFTNATSEDEIVERLRAVTAERGEASGA
jgi:protein SCO1/2